MSLTHLSITSTILSTYNKFISNFILAALPDLHIMVTEKSSENMFNKISICCTNPIKTSHDMKDKINQDIFRLNLLYFSSLTLAVS